MPSAVPLATDGVRGDGDDCDLTVCCIDADNIGASNGVGQLHVDRVCSAIRWLQEKGLKVIIVSQQELSCCLGSSTRSIDMERLLYVKAYNDVVIDMLKTAEEYCCLFMTNREVSHLESDWRLPRRRQSWLRRLRLQLHVQFEFRPDGSFVGRLPETSTSTHARNAKAWLGGSEAADSTRLLAQAGAAASPSKSVLPPAPAAPEACWSSAAAGDQVSGPPVTILPPQSPEAQEALCVLCEEKSDWLFPHSADLAQWIFSDSEKLDEEEMCLSKPAQDKLKATGEAWAYDSGTSIRVVGGAHHGLQALGIGSNYQKRRRACRLALAAAARAGGNMATPAEDPTHDGEFRKLVQAACQLLGTVPPPPPAEAAVGSLRHQPPPPPPPLQTFSGENGTGGHEDSPPPPPQRPVPPASPAAPEPPQAVAHEPQATSEGPNLSGKVVEVIATYAAEGNGYLAVMPGDRIEVVHPNCEPGGPTDAFQSYIFGMRISGPSSDRDGADDSGWFPYDVVRFGVSPMKPADALRL
eukprot:gnl/TRDRNA2_/TRDRNA2_195667_c0_seq1.p1 gnl/TRDRNA2_/TRDRNA2_195667_c0~~gnl/TRDRNA2_/TRDRNA2_195667_c0_seq1.p1  ORF type:complete len:524 (+),score=101.74 gnl/TRDRNA2_/TRDRNA2_195667_c0_seq1:45-1616(+)